MNKITTDLIRNLMQNEENEVHDKNKWTKADLKYYKEITQAKDDIKDINDDWDDEEEDYDENNNW